MKRLFALVLSLALLCPACHAASAPVTRGEFTVALWEAFGGVPYEDTGVFYDVSHNRPDTAAICCGDSFKVTLALTAAPDIVTNPTDIVLVLDRSGSLSGPPFADMKAGAKTFIDIIS